MPLDAYTELYKGLLAHIDLPSDLHHVANGCLDTTNEVLSSGHSSDTLQTEMDFDLEFGDTRRSLTGSMWQFKV
jgi:hypothetical protein